MIIARTKTDLALQQAKMLEHRAEGGSASSVSPQIPHPQGPHSSFLPDRHGSAPSYAATVAQTSSRGPVSSHGPAETSGSPPGSAASYAAVAVSDPAEARTSGIFGSLFYVDDDSPVSVENHFSRTYSETAASELGLAHAMRRPGSEPRTAIWARTRCCIMMEPGGCGRAR